MKHEIARKGFAVVFAVASIVGLAATAHGDDHACSMARAAGKWSFTDGGTVIGIGPRAAVGVFTLDGHGDVLDASATSSLNGSIAVETFSGTYTVNPDCTGTINVTIYASGVAILNVTLNTAFDDGMRQIRGLFTSVTEPNGTPLSTAVALEGRRL
jgi:hypothetical protein